MNKPSVKGKVITGLLLLLIAVIGVVASFVFLFLGFFATDGDVPVDGEAHSVTLDGDGERMIFVEDGGDATCEVRSEDDEPVAIDRVPGTVTRSINGADRVAVGRFDPPGETVQVTCSGSDRLDAQVAPSVISGGRIALLGVGFGGSALLGVIGLVLLVVALVQKAGRARG